MKELELRKALITNPKLFKHRQPVEQLIEIVSQMASGDLNIYPTIGKLLGGQWNPERLELAVRSALDNSDIEAAKKHLKILNNPCKYKLFVEVWLK